MLRLRPLKLMAMPFLCACLCLAQGQSPDPMETGAQLIRQEKYREAIAVFDAILKSRPDSRDARMMLAKAYFHSGDLKAASIHYRQLTETDAGDTEARIELARMLSFLDHTREARTEYEKTLQLKPGYLEARLGLARLLAYERRHSDSIAAYEQILVDNPNNLDATIGLARTLFWSGQNDRAVRLLQPVVEKSQGDAEARELLARIYRAAGNSEAARVIVRSALQETPANRQLMDLNRTLRREGLNLYQTGFAFTRDSDEITAFYFPHYFLFDTGETTSVEVNALFTPVHDPGDTTYSSSALAGFTWEPNPHVTWKSHAGGVFYGDGNERALFGSRIVVQPDKQMRLFLGGHRSAIDYTPRSTRLNVYSDNADATALFFLQPDSPLAFSYTFSRYYGRGDIDQDRSTPGHTASHQASASVSFRVLDEKVKWDQGFQVRYLGFTHEVHAGFFSPNFYINYGPIGTFLIPLRRESQFDLEYSVGLQQLEHNHGQKFAGHVRGQYSIDLKERVRFELGSDYSRAAQLSGGAWGYGVFLRTIFYF